MEINIIVGIRNRHNHAILILLMTYIHPTHRLDEANLKLIYQLVGL